MTVAAPSRVGGVWSVPRDWPGATVVCLATGPSLTQADVDYCRGKAKVIAVNDAYRLAPWADVLYACDGAWWNHHRGAPDFEGVKVSATKNAMAWPDVWLLELTEPQGLATDPRQLCHGGNSGYQAVNLAYHFGASRIILLGYDCQPGPTGQVHYFGRHPFTQTDPPFVLFAQYWPTIAPPLAAAGVEVINCTPTTAIECFERRPLREVL